MSFANWALSCVCLYLCSRSVIGIGIEEEDRMEQWIEDAESVIAQSCRCTFSGITHTDFVRDNNTYQYW